MAIQKFRPSILHEEALDTSIIEFSEGDLITSNDKVFTTADILAASEIINTSNHTIDDCLSNRSIKANELYDPETRISFNQQQMVQIAIENKVNDPLFGLKVGKSLHLTSYGIIGFALLSSKSLTEAIQTAVKFSLLINLKFSLLLQVKDDKAYLRMIDKNGLISQDDKFSIFLEVSKILTLLSDIRGKSLEPNYIDLCLPGGAEQEDEISSIIGADVNLNRPETCIVFPSKILNQKLAQSNEFTHKNCKIICQEQIKRIHQKYDLNYKVQSLLLRSNRVLSLSEVADSLHLSPRTLRRRLDSLDTSYSSLLMEVRKKLAIHLLLNTKLTTEDISENLNYSDAANFRHAFKRWTGCSPRNYRFINKAYQNESTLQS